MTRDAFDQFQQPERGRFGDNELRGRSGEKRGAVTGSSDLVDLDMVEHFDMDRPSAVLVSFGDRTKAVWLPKSLIDLLVTGPSVNKLRGQIERPVRIALPRWKAEQAGLV